MSYDLPAIIRDIPDWDTKTAAECRAYLAETTTVLRTNQQNANDLMLLLGVQTANGLASALSQAGLSLVVASLATSNGIDFGHQTTQDMLTTLGANPSFSPYVSALKALGQDVRSNWLRSGGTGDIPELAVIETAHADAVLYSQKTAASEALRQLLDTINERINDGTLTAEQIAAITLP